jgi:hypothetical protein
MVVSSAFGLLATAENEAFLAFSSIFRRVYHSAAAQRFHEKYMSLIP